MKTRRGKTWKGTYGKRRPRKKKTNVAPKPEVAETTQPASE